MRSVNRLLVERGTREREKRKGLFPPKFPPPSPFPSLSLLFFSQRACSHRLAFFEVCGLCFLETRQSRVFPLLSMKGVLCLPPFPWITKRRFPFRPSSPRENGGRRGSGEHSGRTTRSYSSQLGWKDLCQVKKWQRT